MTEQPLHQQLSAFLSELDSLRQRHQDAQDHAAANERLTFVLDRVHRLQTGLVELRTAAQRLIDLGDPKGHALWASTRADLQQMVPSVVKLSAAALRSANLDLLQWVEYTGAAACLITERCAALERHLAEHAKPQPDQAPASNGNNCGSLVG